MASPSISSFSELDLSSSILKALSQVGYEQPSPIQAASIPPLLEGKDLLGVAQTGTGKTAAFALPMLSRIDISQESPQVLVLAPTRELTIQVAEAFKKYAQNMKGFHVLPIYGGQDMGGQLRQLRRGVHIVVGTPGRVMDHLRRKSLNLDKLKTVVLDEADEMLRMGFIDDVEWILDHTPDTRQCALFSATMPAPIKRVADRYLTNPTEVRIEAATTTVEAIEQSFVQTRNDQKLEALTRILEVEPFDGMIIFVRTKNATVELAEKLDARGYSASPLNGDMTQALRERTVAHLKKEKIDIVVATDVAARGVDVPRITHVMNYDVPYDTDSYVHRIGRTGRAGRTGKAILFVTPREKYMLRSIEKATRGDIPPMKIPSRKEVADQRVSGFKQHIKESMELQDKGISDSFFQEIVNDFCLENACTAEQMAATLTFMLQKERPLQISEKELKNDVFSASNSRRDSRDDGDGRQRRDRKSRDDRGRDNRRDRDSGENRGRGRDSRPPRDENVAMVKYRMDVGKKQNVSPGDIVGAIANEAGLEGQYINNIRIFDNHSTVDLPDGMPKDLFRHLQKIRIRNQAIGLELAEGGDSDHQSESAYGERKERSRPSGKPNRGRDGGDFSGKRKGGDKPPRRGATRNKD